MIPTFRLSDPDDRGRVEALLRKLRLDPRDLVLGHQDDVASVQAILADVAKRGDAALVDIARRFDDPGFTSEQIRVRPDEMKAAASRVGSELTNALRRSIMQVRQYQQHALPTPPKTLPRESGVELGLRFTPLETAGLYFPGGKAAYPSSLIMLTVPAQVAGVGRIVVCSPGSKYGKSDLVLAACYELGLTDVFRVGGAAAIAAMAFGTETVPAVDKIVGPGNRYSQLAKRALAGCVGIDAFLGPSEILVLADDSARADFIAADLIAQAEHDPGSCFLLTTSGELAKEVTRQIERQAATLKRRAALEKALKAESAIILGGSMDELIPLADRFAAEHVNIQTRDDQAVLDRLKHAGAVFLGPYSPVAAGDYVAGPSHCLPTNTTARFSSGISVYEFLKRSSVVRYTPEGLAADAPSIVALANAEGLDGHAASVSVRSQKPEERSQKPEERSQKPEARSQKNT
jgi:histidinol dehydrogenase